jgi:hypothetical protein
VKAVRNPGEPGVETSSAQRAAGAPLAGALQRAAGQASAMSAK